MWSTSVVVHGGRETVPQEVVISPIIVRVSPGDRRRFWDRDRVTAKGILQFHKDLPEQEYILEVRTQSELIWTSHLPFRCKPTYWAILKNARELLKGIILQREDSILFKVRGVDSKVVSPIGYMNISLSDRCWCAGLRTLSDLAQIRSQSAQWSNFVDRDSYNVFIGTGYHCVHSARVFWAEDKFAQMVLRVVGPEDLGSDMVLLPEVS